jgi:hypothetical protein
MTRSCQVAPLAAAWRRRRARGRRPVAGRHPRPPSPDGVCSRVTIGRCDTTPLRGVGFRGVGCQVMLRDVTWYVLGRGHASLLPSSTLVTPHASWDVGTRHHGPMLTLATQNRLDTCFPPA